jgi:hypothetical protein
MMVHWVWHPSQVGAPLRATSMAALQDASLRLTASEFLARVSEIIDSGVARSMDENYVVSTYTPATDCGCCSVM